MSFKLDFASSNLSKNLQMKTIKSMAALKMYAATKAVEIEADMKVNRPWTDRTGLAKATLTTRATENGVDKVRITMAHGVSYGIWLELCNDQNYAIIIPTLEKYSKIITNDLDKLFSNIMARA